MNEFIFLSLENIDDILAFSRVCKKGNEIYKKWKDEWYTIHTQITEVVNEYGNKREIKIVGNRKYITVWYNRTGNKLYEEEYKDGKKEGKWFKWYWSGNKMCEEEYKDGKPEGKWTEWWGNGTKKEEGEFKNGKKEGKWIEWWDDGNKINEEEYKNGKQEGKWFGILNQWFGILNQWFIRAL